MQMPGDGATDTAPSATDVVLGGDSPLDGQVCT